MYDVDSIGLVKLINQFNLGQDYSGKPFGSRSAFTIAVACDPTRDDLVQEVDRFHRKVSGGAHLTMTQPIFDPRCGGVSSNSTRSATAHSLCRC